MFFLLPLFVPTAVQYVPADPCPYPPPLSILVSSFVYGPQLSLEIDTNAARAFAADGAVISILDLNGTTPTVPVATIPVPDCQPLAQLYWKRQTAPNDEYLFIAGGSHGLWRIPLSTGTPYVAESILEIIGGYGAFAFQRKRCVDVVVLEPAAGSGTDPVLVALFASSSYTTHSGPNGPTDTSGPTELRAFRLTGTTVVPLATYEFPSVDPSSGTPPPYEVGTSLAVDPVDHDSVWVGMGKGGIYRADLSGSTFTPNHVPNGWSGIDYVADIAIVRATALATPKSFLYAAMNFVAAGPGPDTGTILEYDLSTFPPAAPTLTQMGCSRPWRISAITEGTLVRVAVAEHKHTVLHGETVAPHVNNGIWTDICVGPGAGETTDDPEIAVDCKEIEVYGRDLMTPAVALTEFQFALTPAGDPPLFYLSTWGSLILRKVGSALKLFACTSEEGTTVWTLDLAATPQPTAIESFAYLGQPSIGAQKGTVTLTNPEIVRFGLEGGSAAGIAASMVHIAPAFPYAITPITGTAAGCTPPASCPPTSAPCNPANTSPYFSAILGEAHWIQEGVSGIEYFFPVSKMLRRIIFDAGCGCVDVLDCVAGWSDPCGSGHRWKEADLVQSTPDPLSLGWRLLRLILPSSGTTTTATMLPNWKQVQAPRNTSEDQSSASNDLGTSISDPRKDSLGFPARAYGIRQGSSVGLKVFKPRDLVNAAGCGGAQAGFGERIDPSSAQALTHIELAKDSNNIPLGCIRDIDCDGNPLFNHSPRQLFNNGADTFDMMSPTGEPLQIVAVAAGFPAGVQITGSLYTCTLEPRRHEPMLVLYDVTTLGGTIQEPTLLKVAIGNGLGSAFDVKVRGYSTAAGRKYYAFVADVTGRLIVFDVSHSELFPATPLDQPYPAGSVLDQCH